MRTNSEGRINLRDAGARTAPSIDPRSAFLDADCIPAEIVNKIRRSREAS